MNLGKVDLLGHSWGGYLVMAYAARHPDRIAHLLIVDSAAPKIEDTAFLFKYIYPETQAREDALAFAVELGDAEAIAAVSKSTCRCSSTRGRPARRSLRAPPPSPTGRR